MADGAEAIANGFIKAFDYKSIEEFIRKVCWAYVDRTYKAKLLKVSSKNIQEEIIHNITRIQEFCCEVVLRNSIKLFNDKWHAVNKTTVNTFLDYFNKESI